MTPTTLPATITINAPELLNCRLKLERATQHWAQLNQLVGQFIDKKPYGLSIHTDMNANELRLSISIREDPPIGFGLLIGDAVHNLATCLDHLVCALAIKNGKSCERTMFPIYTDPVAFRNNGSRWINDLDASAQLKIETLQPFNTDPKAPDQSLLAMLWDLDRIDKHRVVLLGATALESGAGLKFSYATRPNAEIIPEGSYPGPFVDGDIIGRFRCVGILPTEVNIEGSLEFHVGFGKGSGVASGKPVIGPLQRTWHRVANILIDFDPMF